MGVGCTRVTWTPREKEKLSGPSGKDRRPAWTPAPPQLSAPPPLTATGAPLALHPLERPLLQASGGAALFGLHLPHGANFTMQQMVEAVTHAEFENVSARRFARSVVMNGIVEGRRPK